MELKHLSASDKSELTKTFNRTLWNWNQNDLQFVLSLYRLLIVPYGIETQKCDEYLPGHSLLIVPYGIETIVSVDAIPRQESFNRTLWNWNGEPGKDGKTYYTLLIVPYGIETRVMLYDMYEDILTFNRTLWNWN